MLPSVLVSQLQRGVEDFLHTTFPSTTPHFHGMLDRFFDGEGTVFKGPYVNLKLPFEHSGDGPEVFPEVPLQFPPYTHQAAAFERLREPNPQSTLVATGTGSGKTEAFLWPVLDAVRRRKDKPGIKALLIYPMNALATDQAGRIAEAIHSIDALDGVRAGLYVGDQTADGTVGMGPDEVITSRETLRLDPPDLLLTNYKMLDYLLTRPTDRRLWAHNAPDTLRYLVVDELHTFDGAQGTDLACLIRRLTDRLGTPDGHLCCVGTSATLGGPGDTATLRTYAADMFNAPFDEDSVIGETRIPRDVFLCDATEHRLPGEDDRIQLEPQAHPSPEDYIAAQLPLWFENVDDVDVSSEAGRQALGEALTAHAMLHTLIDACEDGPRALPDVVQHVAEAHPDLGERSPEVQRLSVISFLSLIAWARSEVQTHDGTRVETPFMQLRLQLWLRELRRMVASVGDMPDLAFWDDLTDDQRETHLPVAHCLECGAMGWLGLRHSDERRIRPTLKKIYEQFFDQQPTFDFIFPEPTANEIAADGRRFQLCAHDLHLSDPDAPSCEACGQDDALLRVFTPENTVTTKAGHHVGKKDCPYCSAPRTLTILGSRAASLTSVMISQLFASTHNDDKKLLTFSDSVQDAAHRAGFFEARTFRFNLRSAIQQFVDQEDEAIPLDALQDRVVAHYRDAMGDRTFVSTFIAPDMQWFQDYDHLRTYGSFRSDSTLAEDVSRRVKWEVWSEYGFRARIGRTLEKTGSSVASVDEQRIQAAVESLGPVLRNEIGHLRDADDASIRRFVHGIVEHLKLEGAIHHSELRTYIERGGDYYVISQRRKPYMPRIGRSSRLPAFLATRGTNRFHAVMGSASTPGRSWMQAWAIKCFGDLDPTLETHAQSLYVATLQNLTRAAVLEKRENRHGSVWGLVPAALRVSNDVTPFRCDTCGHQASTAARLADDWSGMRCLRRSCLGRYAEDDTSGGYYRDLYRRGDLHRIVAREHTGLLGREDREALEHEFKHGEDPWATNLISCTPTLEMGVDIGQLSTVVLCSVPPGPAHFLQRIGRGGRRSGNAVDVTVANGKPHDLYFFADPAEMIAGTVQPPGVFLGAVAVLFRQYIAYCLGRWVATGVSSDAIPSRLSSLLKSYQNEASFPNLWLSYVEEREDELFDAFVALFGDRLNEERRSKLWDLIQAEGGIAYQILNALEAIHTKRKDLHRRSRRLYRTVRALEKGAITEAQQQKIDELNRERSAVQGIYKRIGEINTFNFLTDAGVLPNYAFPESGVTLRSILYRGGADGGDVWDDEYVRPAPRAIRELAPGATFYAQGRRVTVDQIDLSGEDTIEQWRLCDRCGYMQRTAEADSPPGSCDQCGSPHWGDQGQVRSLVRQEEMAATTKDRESRIDDSSEGRDRSFFETEYFITIPKDHVEQAYRIDDDTLPFGFEYVASATFREVNFGEPGPSLVMEAGGREIKGRGFLTCPSCGRVGIDGDIRHTGSCRDARQDKEASAQPLFLYRQLESEAGRILLPETSFAGAPEKVESLKAAIHLGLEEAFDGSVDHIKSVVQEAPGRSEIARRKYLVIYDSVPGGTGYLADLFRSKETFLGVLNDALDVLKACPCAEEDDQDGCYQCLYAYRNAYDMPHTSRSAAIELLRGIVNRRDDLVEIETVDDISVISVVESELEARFIQRLADLDGVQSRIERKTVRGRTGYELSIDGSTFDIEPQVEVGPSDGVARRVSIDFVFHPHAEGRRPIAVFLDGFQYHRNRIPRDLSQRRALLASGLYDVWSFTWQDITQGTGADHYRNYLIENDDRYVGLMKKMGEAERTGTARTRLTQGSFTWFIDVLRSEERPFWTKIAAAQALLYAVEQTDADDWLSSAERHLPPDLVDALQEEAEQENVLLGHVDQAPDGATDPVRIWSAVSPETACALQEDEESAAAGIFVAFHLNDNTETTSPDDLQRAWNGLLRLYNLFQFLPATYPAAGMPDAIPSYAELMGTVTPPVINDPKGLYETASPEADVDPDAWREAMGEALDETVDLLSTLRSASVPPPVIPYGHMNNGAIALTVELGWPDAKAAVYLPDQAEQAEPLEDKGWLLLSLSEAEEDPGRLIDWIRAASLSEVEY